MTDAPMPAEALEYAAAHAAAVTADLECAAAHARASEAWTRLARATAAILALANTVIAAAPIAGPAEPREVN